MTLAVWEELVKNFANVLIEQGCRATKRELIVLFEAVAVSYPGGELDKEHARDTNSLLEGME